MIEVLEYFALKIVNFLKKGIEFFNDKVVDIITGLFVDPIYKVRITMATSLPNIVSSLGENWF